MAKKKAVKAISEKASKAKKSTKKKKGTAILEDGPNPAPPASVDIGFNGTLPGKEIDYKAPSVEIGDLDLSTFTIPVTTTGSFNVEDFGYWIQAGDRSIPFQVIDGNTNSGKLQIGISPTPPLGRSQQPKALKKQKNLITASLTVTVLAKKRVPSRS